MDESKILDWNPLMALGLFPEIEEDIIWAGQPGLKPLIPGINRSDFNRFWLAYYLGIFACIRLSFSTGSLVPTFVMAAAILAIQVIPSLVSYLRIRRTAYVVTNKRIALRLWHFFAEKVHVIRYDDFQWSTFVMNYPGTNFGTVYLMTGKDVGFWTYDLDFGDRRQHPTLECVKDAEQLALKIEKTRVDIIGKNKPSPLVS